MVTSRPSGLTHEPLASRSRAAESLGAVMSYLPSVGACHEGSATIVPPGRWHGRSGPSVHFIYTADACTERGSHLGGVRISDVDRHPAGAYRGTSSGCVVGPAEEPRPARTCLS